MVKPLLRTSKRARLAAQIGGRIRAFRREQGFDREDLAAMVGVHRDRIIAYENGDALPPLYTLLRLSQVLRTSVDGLLSDAHEVPISSQIVIDRYRELSALPVELQQLVAQLLGDLMRWVQVLRPRP